MTAGEVAVERGLTAAEVERERAAGHVNVHPDRASRSYADIVRGNVLTRFNAIISVLAAVVLVVGHPIDAIFAGVMVVNTAIGIVQEARAKSTLDRLRVLITPEVTVIRDGAPRRVPPDELVLGDVVRLAPGDQVPVDGVVLAAVGLDVDESALTGEADAVAKAIGDDVRSGSAVVAGSAVVRATAVGTDAWIHQLLAQAKEFVLATSELRHGVDRILRVVGWIIGPLAALLLWSQLRDQSSTADGLVSAVAGVVGLVPQGLVLLVSMALAVAVVRLARNHVVVQELHAVEGLARVDVLCLDKTGTLTTGAMQLDRIETFDVELHLVTAALAALAASETSPSATLAAAAGDTPAPGWSTVEQVPFSSARKWSGATFAGDDDGSTVTWVVGAPEVLMAATTDSALAEVEARIRELAEDARRLLLVARAEERLVEPVLPPGLEPVALVVITEEVRDDAAETMRYFADQHVTVKIISGDNPATVSAVAARLGVAGAERHVDMRTVDLGGPVDEIAALVDGATVFGRVLPQQKRELVEVLQRGGHTVAMTGDGVNDIPALKKADIGIAMDTATAATKAVSQLVLLDGRFDRLPAVVGEGRRVITNMERVSALFVTKTVYATLFALVIGVWGAAFPFLPRHMSLVSELTIGVPAFALSFRAADRPYRPGYLTRVLRFALPAGVVTAATTLVAYWMLRSPLLDVQLDEARTGATLVLIVLALWVLALLMHPIDRFDAAVLGAMTGLSVLAVGTPVGRTFYGLHWPDLRSLVILAAYVTGVIVLATIAVRQATLRAIVERTVMPRRR